MSLIDDLSIRHGQCDFYIMALLCRKLKICPGFFLLYFKTTCMILTLQANTKYLFLPLVSVFGFLRLFVHYWMHTRTGRGLFLLSGYKQMQNSEFHYRLQWFISFFAYFSHLIWNIGSDIVFFAGTLRLTCQHHNQINCKKNLLRCTWTKNDESVQKDPV